MSLLIKRILLFSLLLSLGQYVQSQDVSYWKLTDEDGLPGMAIYQIVQDQKGYMWFATSNGICRYDGQEFEYFQDRRFKDSEMVYMEEDRLGRMWIKNLSGQLFLIDGDSIKYISEYLENPIDKILDFKLLDTMAYLLIPDDVEGILQKYPIQKNGEIGKPYTFPISIKHLRFIIKSEDLLLVPAVDLQKDHLVNIAIKGGVDEVIPIELDTDELAFNYFVNYYSDDFFLVNHNYKKKLVRHNPDQTKSKITFPSISHLNALSRFQDHFYLATKSGVIKTDLSLSVEQTRTLLNGITCNTIAFDREGNMWIGTNEEGVLIVPSLEVNILNAENGAIPNDQVFDLYVDAEQNRLLIGQKDAFLSIVNPNGQVNSQKLPSSGRVLSMFRDIDQNLWINTDGNTLLQKAGQANYQSFIGGEKVMISDQKGNLWRGRSNSTQIVSLDSGIYDKDGLMRFKGINVITNERTYALLEDFNKAIWIGTTNGIYRYDNQLTKLLNEDQDTPYNVSDFYQTPDSSIWASVYGDGVLRIRNQKVERQFTTANGLTSNNCKKLEYKDGWLWIATSNGVNKLNIQTNEIQVMNISDGLPSKDISDIAFWEDKVWIATSKGVTSFPETFNHYNTIPPTIEIEAFKIWERDTTILDRYDLPFDQNNILIEFVGFGYKSRGTMKYRYQLSGVDPNWVETTARSVRYPKLNPGKYSFSVYSVNEDGVSSSVPVTIEIEIAPPWWQTWWFRFFAGVVILGGAYALIRWRFDQIRAQEKVKQQYLEELNELENRALRLQMNPHFIYNTLNAIQYFLSNNEEKPAMLYLSRFAKLIRMIFEQSKKKTIFLDEELDFLKMYLNLEQLRFRDKISVQMEIDQEVEDQKEEIKIPPLLIQPIIENAFKHGLFQKQGHGIVKIHFFQRNDFLHCSVEDNGVGRQNTVGKGEWRTKYYQPSGLATTSERLRRTNTERGEEDEGHVEITDLFDGSGNPSGTRVEIKIRLTNYNHKND